MEYVLLILIVGGFATLYFKKSNTSASNSNELLVQLNDSLRKEIQEIREKINVKIKCIILSREGTKKYINKKINEWEVNNNKQEIRRCTSLQHYDIINKKKKEYLNEVDWEGINKFRMGQLVLVKKTYKINNCVLCEDNIKLDLEV